MMTQSQVELISWPSNTDSDRQIPLSPFLSLLSSLFAWVVTIYDVYKYFSTPQLRSQVPQARSDPPSPPPRNVHFPLSPSLKKHHLLSPFFPIDLTSAFFSPAPSHNPTLFPFSSSTFASLRSSSSSRSSSRPSPFPRIDLQNRPIRFRGVSR